MKFQDLKQEYKRYALVEHGMRPKTHKQIERSTEMLFEYLHTEEIENVTEEDVRDFLRHSTLEKGWSLNTYRIYRQYILLFFKWCISKQYLKKNPTNQIAIPEIPKITPRHIQEEEADKILHSTVSVKWYYKFEKPRNEAIIAMLCIARLRASELLNLKITDINIQDATIVIRNRRGAISRSIPIQYQLLDILQKYITEKQRLGKPSTWFFTGAQSDKKLGYKNLLAICKRITIESGVKFTPRMLRSLPSSIPRKTQNYLAPIRQYTSH